MPISFVETMRGWLHGDTGPEFPISFELVALQSQGGKFEARGVLSAPPLTRETPARGTLEMGIGFIAYHLDFVAADGRKLHLDATKHPTPLAPVRSMTRMHAAVKDESGRLVASGEMRFALRDLPGFLASWLPVRRQDQHLLESRRRGLERLALLEKAGGAR